jgi:hypothetical protein
MTTEYDALGNVIYSDEGTSEGGVLSSIGDGAMWLVDNGLYNTKKSWYSGENLFNIGFLGVSAVAGAFSFGTGTAAMIGTRVTVGTGAKILLRETAEEAVTVATRAVLKETAQETAETVVRKSLLGRVFNSPVTYGGLLIRGAALAAGGYALSAFNVLSGGKLSQSAVETTVDGIRASINSGLVSAENFENAISTAGHAIELSRGVEKAFQNGGVAIALASYEDPTSPDAVSAGKAAALGWTIEPTNLISNIGSHYLRLRLVDDIYPNRDEADLYLAQQLVNDIVDKSYASELGDNQVTEDDVKNLVQKTVAENPDSPLVKNLFQGRLANGMRQMWPDVSLPTFAAEEEILESKDSPLSTSAGQQSLDSVRIAFMAIFNTVSGVIDDFLPKPVVGVVAGMAAAFMIAASGDGNDNTNKIQELSGLPELFQEAALGIEPEVAIPPLYTIEQRPAAGAPALVG